MSDTNTAVLFAGQGAQSVGMGRSLAERNPEIMDLWKKAEKISNIPLRELYWDGGEGLDDTRLVQPALTVSNICLWFELSRHLRPAATAGHSLGEYCALIAASVLSFENVIELVTLRGQLMADADPSGKGAMAAIVKLDLQQAEELVALVRAECNEAPDAELRIVNYNTPSQYVASGSRAAIDLLVEKAREVKGRAIPLAVSGAFHSPYMAEASKELAKAVNKYKFSDPRFPVYCNVSGTAAHRADEVKELLLRQMTSPVRWIDTIRNQHGSGINRFVECSPKNVLAKMVEQILAPVAEKDSYQTATVTSAKDIDLF